MADFEFDVALSFAGEDRLFVEEIAVILRPQLRVFYDDFEEVNLWGKDLVEHFDEVYRRKSRFVMLFISAHYAAKAWTRHELRSALARALEERGPFLLPVRLDDTELPGLRTTIGYLDGRILQPREIADRILKKLGQAPALVAGGAAAVSSPPSPFPPADFNPYAEAGTAVEVLRGGLTLKAAQLKPQGFVVHAADRNGRFVLRVMHTGRTLYGLDIWIGTGWDENGICFSTSADGSNSTNAQGSIEWDRKRGKPIIKLLNLSLLPYRSDEYRLTASELVDAIWESIQERLAAAM